MHIRVLGCHGADQLVGGAAGFVRRESCGFLVDGSVLLDAGTVGTRLTLEEQRAIRVVLLSHLHFDHIKGLPTFIDNLAEQFDEPVTVAATEPVIQGLRDYVFNDSLYPNFFALPSRQNPVLKARILEPGKPTSFGQIEVIPVPVNHTVPTVGYMIKDRKAALLYSGDTHETEEIWSVARTTPLLQAAFIEASFPEECAELAQQTKHLTPSLLASEWQKANKEQVPVYAYHLKPLFRDAIAQQLHALGIPRLSILEEGQTITL